MSRSPMSSRVSAEMTSEGSSTSDEEKRRSGSVERHYHSPDHLRGSVVSGEVWALIPDSVDDRYL